MSKPKRRLQHIIVELQQELDEKHRQLEAELGRNREARIHCALVSALCGIGHAISDLLGVPGLGGAPRAPIGACDSDAELDARVGELISLMEQAAAARGAAGSAATAAGGLAASDTGSGVATERSGPSATDASGGASGSTAAGNAAEPPVGTLGVPTSSFLASVRAVYSADGMERDEFVAYARDCVHRAAVLAHQQAWDEGAREQLKGLLHQLSSRCVGLCLRKLWFFSLFNYNLSAGTPEEGPKAVWARTAASMQLTPEQDFAFEIMTRWWKSQEEGLQSRRRALAEVSTAAPGDVELQDEVAGELGKVLTLYKVALMPFMVLLSCALLQPAQLAAFYVQSWPWMPVLTPILEALEERRASGRDAAAATDATGVAAAAAAPGASPS